jgi:hypothetical protein
VKLPREKEVWRLLGQSGRYALDAALLEIDDGKGTLIVTNGMAMAALPVEVEEGDEPGLIPGEALREEPAPVEEYYGEHVIYHKPATPDRSLRVSNGRAVESTVTEREKNSPEEFPKWRGVLPPPDAPVAVEVMISATLLHDMAMAMGAISRGVKLRIPMPRDGQVRDPIRVEGPDGAVGSIMSIVIDPE